MCGLWHHPLPFQDPFSFGTGKRKRGTCQVPCCLGIVPRAQGHCWVPGSSLLPLPSSQDLLCCLVLFVSFPTCISAEKQTGEPGEGHCNPGERSQMQPLLAVRGNVAATTKYDVRSVRAGAQTRTALAFLESRRLVLPFSPPPSVPGLPLDLQWCVGVVGTLGINLVSPFLHLKRRQSSIFIRAQAGNNPLTLCDLGQIPESSRVSFPQLQTEYHKISYLLGRVRQDDVDEQGKSPQDSGPPMTFPVSQKPQGRGTQVPTFADFYPRGSGAPKDSLGQGLQAQGFPSSEAALLSPPGQDLRPLPLHHLLYLLCPGALCPRPLVLQGEATIFLPQEYRPRES